MSSVVRLMALSVSPVSGVGLVRVSGVRWLRRKWSRWSASMPPVPVITGRPIATSLSLSAASRPLTSGRPSISSQVPCLLMSMSFTVTLTCVSGSASVSRTCRNNSEPGYIICCKFKQMH